MSSTGLATRALEAERRRVLVRLRRVEQTITAAEAEHAQLVAENAKIVSALEAISGLEASRPRLGRAHRPLQPGTLRATIVDVVGSAEQVSIDEVVTLTGGRRTSVGSFLRALYRDGLVDRVGHGLYRRAAA